MPENELDVVGSSPKAYLIIKVEQESEHDRVALGEVAIWRDGLIPALPYGWERYPFDLDPLGLLDRN